MSYKSPWPVPYPGISSLPKDKKKRITTELPNEDYKTIVSVTLNSYILTTISQYAIARTAEFCRVNGLTSNADYERLIEFICQRPVGGVAPSTATSDDGRRTEEVRGGVAPGADVPAGVGETSPSKSKGQGRGRGGKGGKKSDEGKGKAGVGG